MTIDHPAEVAKIRREYVAVVAEWQRKIVEHLREHGPSTTHEIAVAVGKPPARQFHRFRDALRKAPGVARIGERPGPTGHVNIVWALQ